MPTREAPVQPAAPAAEPAVAVQSRGALLLAVGALLLVVLLIVTNMK